MANIYISRKIRNIILIVLILFSLLVGVKRSDIISTLLSKPKRKVTRKTRADEIFSSSDYETNINLRYKISENRKSKKYAKAKNRLKKIIDKYDINVRYNNQSGSALSYILEIPKDKYEKIFGELKATPGLISNNFITNTVIDPKNLEKRINILKETEDVYRNHLKKSRLTTRQMREIKKELQVVGSEIDSLKTVIRQINKRKDYVLAQIKMDRVLSKSLSSQLSKFQTFLGWSIGSFLIGLIALTIAYGIYIITLKLLSAAGIRTKKGGGRYGSRYSKYGYGKYGKYGGYGGYSGYGGYGGYGSYGSYGYGKKKKVKRKYIRKDSKEGEENNTNGESEDDSSSNDKDK